MAYDLAGQLQTTKKPRTGITSYTYDNLGRQTSITDPLNYTTTMRYDPVGNLLERKNARTASTVSEYDSLNRQIKQTDALGGITTRQYDLAGDLLAVTDANLHTTKYDYNAMGWRVRTTNPLNEVSTTAYDPDGLVVAQTDGLQHTTTRTYDAAGQPISVTSPRGATSRISYDADGNQTLMIDALGNHWATEYDALNQPVAKIDPLGRRTEITRDALSRQTVVKSPRGFTTTYGYDKLNRINRVTDANLQTATYGYDADGNKVSFTDVRGNTELWSYDLADRNTSYTNQLGHTWFYTRNEVGSQIGMLNPNKFTLIYGFDLLERMTAIRYPDGFVQTRSYDAVGNLTDLVDRSGPTHFKFDALNRPQSEDHNNRVTQASYDAAGNLVSLSLPNGQPQHWDYNADNQPVRVTDQANGQYTFEPDLLGRDTKLTYPNGATTFKNYDAAGELTSLANYAGHGQLLTAYGYTFDADGNRTQVRSTIDFSGGSDNGDKVGLESKTQPYQLATSSFSNGVALNHSFKMVNNYTYDKLDRLVNETQTVNDDKNTLVSVDYRLDANGNITNQRIQRPNPKSGSSPLQYNKTSSYDRANHLVGTVEDNGGSVSLDYDADGNRVSQKTGTNVMIFGYDYEDRMVSVDTNRHDNGGDRVQPANTGPRTGMTQYLYDGLGRLRATYYDKAGQPETAKNADSYRYYWGVQRVDQETGPTDDHSALYYTLGGTNGVLGTVLYEGGHGNGGDKRNPVAVEAGYLQREYLQHDDLGSPVVATDLRGNIVGAQLFSSYGEQFASLHPEKLPDLGFTGQDYENGTGLTHFHARWYDASTTRWLNEDPYRAAVGDPVLSNLSLYVRSNPVNKVDQLGYFDTGDWVGGLFNSVVDTIVDIVIDIGNITGADISGLFSSQDSWGQLTFPIPEFSPSSRSNDGHALGVEGQASGDDGHALGVEGQASGDDGCGCSEGYDDEIVYRFGMATILSQVTNQNLSGALQTYYLKLA